MYSFVVWLHRLNPKQSKPILDIANRLSISENSASAAAKSLEKQGFVTIGTGRSNRTVIRLTERRPDWLVIGSQGEPASNRLYQRAATSKSSVRLTSLDLALLATLYGLAIQRGTFLLKNAKSGLAKMVSASLKTIRSSLNKFAELGLTKCVGNEIALIRPPSETLRLFADCGTAESKKQPGGLFFYLDLDNATGVRLNELLISVQARQFEAGWQDKQAFDFWNSIFSDSLKNLKTSDRLLLLEEFLAERFSALWLAAEEQHKETGKAGNCRYLLKISADDAITRLKRERGYV